MKISVVIPVYGCKNALVPLYNRLTKTLISLTNDYEIILVNDNCPQNSWEIIEELCQNDTHVIGIEMARNFGQIKAITAGLDYCTGDWAVVMDCDLQDQPEEIINLYNKATEGYDVVFARRENRKDSFFKILVSNIFYKIYSFASDGNYDPTLCNFSIINRKVINSYCQMRELHRAYVIYIKWLGYKQTAINVKHESRYEGKSSYNFKKRMAMAFDILTSQSDKLLKMMMICGFIITGLSLIFIIYLLINYFISNILIGWTSIIATISLFGGIILSAIGIVGIYIGNIYMQVKDRPLYTVRNILNKKHNDTI